MRWLVHISLLAVATCSFTNATFAKSRHLPLQNVQPAVQPVLGQQYSYYLPPVQRYIYLNGLPYAVLGEQLQYLPATDAALSPYTSAVNHPIGPTLNTNSAASAAGPGGAINGQVTQTDNLSATASGTAYASSGGSSITEETTTYKAPASAPNPSEPATQPAAGPASDPAPEPAIKTNPSQEPAPSIATSSAPESVSDMHAPATAPAPHLAAQPSAPVYLSSSSEPGMPPGQRILVLSVSNPRVTVTRKDTVYSWHHPAQSVNGPIDMVFYNDRKGVPAPASDQLQAGTKTLGAPFSGVSGIELSSTQDLSPEPTTRADLIGYTLSQSPLLRLHVDPATRSSFYMDSEGRRVDLSGVPTASPAAAGPVTWAHPANQFHPYYGAASSSLAAAQWAHSGMPAPLTNSVSENIKVQDMAGLRPLERMYAPSTFNAPAPLSANNDKPLTLSISTGQEAEDGPPSPLSPQDLGPSRGDSV